MTRTALAPQLNQHISQPFIEMHINDAAARHLTEGQLVTVKSKWGQMLAPVTINQNPKPSDIFVPLHWTAQLSRPGRVNPVVNPEVDAFSKQPESKHTPVQVNAFDANWFGFVLSRNPIDWPNTEYVVSAQGNQHTRLELAHSKPIDQPIKTMMAWLGFESLTQIESQELEILSYEDETSGLYRLALLNKQGQLDAVAMVAPNTQLPERTWLASQFSNDTLNKRARAALLSGYAPIGEDIGRIVCACFSVGEKTIEAAVKSGCCTPAMVGDTLKAGTNCGSCVPEIKGIVARVNIN
jgi:assimilatory nitrate reductase catalytic subunit